MYSFTMYVSFRLSFWKSTHSMVLLTLYKPMTYISVMVSISQ